MMTKHQSIPTAHEAQTEATAAGTGAQGPTQGEHEPERAANATDAAWYAWREARAAEDAAGAAHSEAEKALPAHLQLEARPSVVACRAKGRDPEPIYSIEALERWRKHDPYLRSGLLDRSGIARRHAHYDRLAAESRERLAAFRAERHEVG